MFATIAVKSNAQALFNQKLSHKCPRLMEYLQCCNSCYQNRPYILEHMGVKQVPPTNPRLFVSPRIFYHEASAQLYAWQRRLGDMETMAEIQPSPPETIQTFGTISVKGYDTCSPFHTRKKQLMNVPYAISISAFDELGHWKVDSQAKIYFTLILWRWDEHETWQNLWTRYRSPIGARFQPSTILLHCSN